MLLGISEGHNPMKRDRRLLRLQAEAEKWALARDLDPFDRSPRENLGEILFQIYASKYPSGSIKRGRLILRIISASFPIDRLTTAYFDNLERLLARRAELAIPGNLVLGVGAGRCGSTSLASMLGSIPGSCCTHENPPNVYWEPLEEQIGFHLHRFSLLIRFFSLVFDAAHWWINACDRVFSNFQSAKAIGLCREIHATAASFMKIKGQGLGSINHWAPLKNGFWRPNAWDPTYPTYSVPAHSDPDTAKSEMIHQYVFEYNIAMRLLAQRFRERMMLVRTESLGMAPVQEEIFRFVGHHGRVAQYSLNVGTIHDGVLDTYRF